MNFALDRKSQNSLHQLREWSQRGQLFALVDPFFELGLPTQRRRLDKRDTDPVFYEVIAWEQVTYEPPYLIEVSPETLQWILNTLPTERWGLFIAADTNIDTLAIHFQKFVIAKGPDRNPYFLRFHDASVLEVLLETWDNKDIRVFFGPVMAFGLPDLDSMAVNLFRSPLGERHRGLPKPEDCLLRLQESQLNKCSAAIDRDLVKVIYWHLRNHHARVVQFISRDVLEDRIRYAIRRARQYSLGTISDLAGYTALMFELAPNFDQHPSFRRVLQDPSVPPEAKMRRLSQVISDREWEEAVALFDRTFWSTVTKRAKAKG